LGKGRRSKKDPQAKGNKRINWKSLKGFLQKKESPKEE